MVFQPTPAPKGYVPGLGRGAAGFTTRSDIGPAAAAGTTVAGNGTGSRSSEIRAAKLKQQQRQLQQTENNTAEEEEEDLENPEEEETYLEIDEILATRRHKKRHGTVDEHGRSKKQQRQLQLQQKNPNHTTIGDQFHDLKQELATVTENDWASIPECVGDLSLRYKQKQLNNHNNNPLNEGAILSDTLLLSHQEQKSSVTQTSTAATPSLAGLAEARGTLLNMTLNKMSDSVTGQTVVDPKGYLTGLTTMVNNSGITTTTDVSDIHKARALLKSVRDTNPKHGPGWIAAARVEEASGNVHAARKLLQEACQVCSDNADVWMEAARLHPPDAAKAILAAAVRRCSSTVQLFVQAADLESSIEAKKAVLRKALEANPHSVTLWKAAIDCEDDVLHAKVLLSVAVEKVPHSVEMWLALARLEDYAQAKQVLNKARKTLPNERAIWIAAAKLEENHGNDCTKIIVKAVQTLPGVTRDLWLKEAEHAELQGKAPKTSAAIIQHTLHIKVEERDRQRTWSTDAKGALSRNAVATSRAILAHALAVLPTKRSLWMQAIELEKQHGNTNSLVSVLEAASTRLPNCELFWLWRAKELWTVQNNIQQSREVLRDAFAANPNSEAVWLAAAKLEWETGEPERARVLLSRAQERAPSGRVYMKSAVLERNCQNTKEALRLLQEGISKYPSFAKLYMMGGQISADSLNNLDGARKFYQKGLKHCPKECTLWILASRLEETYAKNIPKARSILELARVQHTQQAELWLEAIRLEHRHSSVKDAKSLLARALQDCPTSGILLKESIVIATTRTEQKSKSAHAIQTCPDDPHVISAVATLFASEKKVQKARKWFDRALVLNPDIGDTWAQYYALELSQPKNKQTNIQQLEMKCHQAEPKHGEVWCSIRKQIANERKPTIEILKLVAQHMIDNEKRKQQETATKLVANGNSTKH